MRLSLRRIASRPGRWKRGGPPSLSNCRSGVGRASCSPVPEAKRLARMVGGAPRTERPFQRPDRDDPVMPRVCLLSGLACPHRAAPRRSRRALRVVDRVRRSHASHPARRPRRCHRLPRWRRPVSVPRRARRCGSRPRSVADGAYWRSAGHLAACAALDIDATEEEGSTARRRRGRMGRARGSSGLADLLGSARCFALIR